MRENIFIQKLIVRQKKKAALSLHSFHHVGRVERKRRPAETDHGVNRRAQGQVRRRVLLGNRE